MISKDLGRTAIKMAGKQKAFVATILMFILMTFFNTNFYTAQNLFQILNTVSINLILAGGVTLLLLGAACDLSIGATLGLSGIITIKLMNSGVPMGLAFLCSLAMGAAVGFVNGFLVVHQKTDPFIITLGTGMAIKGISQVLTDAHPIAAQNSSFMEIANGKVFGVIPNLVVFMVVILAIIHCVLRYTQFGRNIYAVGDDYEVAVYAGINARRTKWTTFVLCGMTAALGGILYASLLNTGSSVYGDTVGMLVHCGAVIGGTSLTGGVGGIPQTALGLISLAVLANCMNTLGIGMYIQLLVQGIAIVTILWLDRFGMKRIRDAV